MLETNTFKIETIDLSSRLASHGATAYSVYTPQSAHDRLIALGYSDSAIYGSLLSGKEQSSHAIHALAVIATGQQNRDLNDVFHQLYPPSEKAHLTEADIKADTAADQAYDSGAWDKFTSQPN